MKKIKLINFQTLTFNEESLKFNSVSSNWPLISKIIYYIGYTIHIMIVNFWLYSIIRARDLVSLKAIARGISHNKIVILMSHWCWNLTTFCPHQNKGAVARIIIYQSGFFYFTFSSFFILLHYKRKIAKCLWFRAKSYEKVGQAFLWKGWWPFQNWHPLVIQFQDSLFFFFFFQDLNVVKRRLAYHWKFNN